MGSHTCDLYLFDFSQPPPNYHSNNSWNYNWRHQSGQNVRAPPDSGHVSAPPLPSGSPPPLPPPTDSRTHSSHPIEATTTPEHRSQAYYHNSASSGNYHGRGYNNAGQYGNRPGQYGSASGQYHPTGGHYSARGQYNNSSGQYNNSSVPYNSNSNYNSSSNYQRNNHYNKRKADTEPEGLKKPNKRKKKPLSQNSLQRKDWSVLDAMRALTVEKDYNKKNKSQSLIIKFPDLELNRDIVFKFNSSIDNVHFQQPSTPRFCFVTLKDSADPEAVIKELNKIPFGQGHLMADFKRDREEDINIGPEDIDPLTLYVGNLAQEVTKDDMVNTYPKQKRIDIGYAKKMKYTRYAFVSFKNVDDSIEAFKKTHGAQMYSKSLIVRFRRLHGTVGMPGEPKPLMPQRSEADTPNVSRSRTNSNNDHNDIDNHSHSSDIENENCTNTAPWDMVDVSRWDINTSGSGIDLNSIKEEPIDVWERESLPQENSYTEIIMPPPKQTPEVKQEKDCKEEKEDSSSDSDDNNDWDLPFVDRLKTVKQKKDTENIPKQPVDNSDCNSECLVIPPDQIKKEVDEPSTPSVTSYKYLLTKYPTPFSKDSIGVEIKKEFSSELETSSSVPAIQSDEMSGNKICTPCTERLLETHTDTTSNSETNIPAPEQGIRVQIEEMLGNKEAVPVPEKNVENQIEATSGISAFPTELGAEVYTSEISGDINDVSAAEKVVNAESNMTSCLNKYISATEAVTDKVQMDKIFSNEKCLITTEKTGTILNSIEFISSTEVDVKTKTEEMLSDERDKFVTEIVDTATNRPSYINQHISSTEMVGVTVGTDHEECTSTTERIMEVPTDTNLYITMPTTELVTEAGTEETPGNERGVSVIEKVVEPETNRNSYSTIHISTTEAITEREHIDKMFDNKNMPATEVVTDKKWTDRKDVRDFYFQQVKKIAKAQIETTSSSKRISTHSEIVPGRIQMDKMVGNRKCAPTARTNTPYIKKNVAVEATSAKRHTDKIPSSKKRASAIEQIEPQTDMTSSTKKSILPTEPIRSLTCMRDNNTRASVIKNTEAEAISTNTNYNSGTDENLHNERRVSAALNIPEPHTKRTSRNKKPASDAEDIEDHDSKKKHRKKHNSVKRKVPEPIPEPPIDKTSHSRKRTYADEKTMPEIEKKSHNKNRTHSEKVSGRRPSTKALVRGILNNKNSARNTEKVKVPESNEDMAVPEYNDNRIGTYKDSTSDECDEAENYLRHRSNKSSDHSDNYPWDLTTNATKQRAKRKGKR